MALFFKVKRKKRVKMRLKGENEGIIVECLFYPSHIIFDIF